MPCLGIAVAHAIGPGRCSKNARPPAALQKQALAEAKADADKQCPAWCACEPAIAGAWCKEIRIAKSVYRVWIVAAVCPGNCH